MNEEKRNVINLIPLLWPIKSILNPPRVWAKGVEIPEKLGTSVNSRNEETMIKVDPDGHFGKGGFPECYVRGKNTT